MWIQHLAETEPGLHFSRQPFDPALPCLLCVHGAGGRGRLFTPQLEGLARAANVAAIDLPGHGQSRGPSFESIEDYAAWLAEFLERGPLRPVLLGHYMGGAIAQTLALTRPDLLQGIALVATGARLKAPPRLLTLLREDYPKACADLAAMTYGTRADSALLGQAKEELSAMRPEVVLGDFLACDRFDLRGRLQEIDLPALVLVGTRDRLTPPNYAAYLASNIRSSRLEIIETAGHGLFREAPGPFNQALQDFLASL